MKVKDVICGMTIDAESAAASVHHEGKSYYFCSEHCRKTFEADPHRYGTAGGVGGEASGHAHHEHAHPHH
ncbi:MAG TPA: YHS domain-containing protein [Longimicrobiales bacterium]|jgi:Cu+-exporting ATPase|nr:YHS domain-containing protein [Longimicrobiales bacterium]